MTTMKRADEVVQGEWVRVGQKAFRVGKIWTDLDQLCFQVGRGGDGFYRFWPDRDVEVVALVDYAEKAKIETPRYVTIYSATWDGDDCADATLHIDPVEVYRWLLEKASWIEDPDEFDVTTPEGRVALVEYLVEDGASFTTDESTFMF